MTVGTNVGVEIILMMPWQKFNNEIHGILRRPEMIRLLTEGAGVLSEREKVFIKFILHGIDPRINPMSDAEFDLIADAIKIRLSTF